MQKKQPQKHITLEKYQRKKSDSRKQVLAKYLNTAGSLKVILAKYFGANHS